MKWSLVELYPSFDSKEYIDDLNILNEGLNEFLKFADENFKNQENPMKKIETYIEYSRDLGSLLSKLMAFSRLTLSTEATNELALKEAEKLQMLSTEFTKPNVQFMNFIGKTENLGDLIDGSPLLKEHEFFLKQISQQTKYMLSEDEEVLISKMKNTGSTAWTNLQNMITSTILIDFELEGKTVALPLPAIRNLAYHSDGDIRKSAYEAELNAYPRLEQSSCAALNGIKGEVITICERRGYESPLDETLQDSRMTQKTLDAMFTAMEESFPTFHRYFRRKAEVLGYKNGLPFYDLFAPMGNINSSFTYEEAMDYVVKNFSTFSDKLGNYAKNAYEKNWIDVLPREGKRGGAFCSNLHPIGESRILANFDGSFSNTITLAHELGHGYHGLNLKEESFLNSSYPMPIAETASIFCETIVMNAALKDANVDEELSLLESSISDSAQVIVDIYSRFLFESEVFERRKSHALSVNEMKEIMLSAQKEAYGDGLDEAFLHPYMWINKTHYYSAGRNFYNFPYAFGLLFSKGLYAEYLKRGQDFIGEYDELLRATGSKDIVDVAKMMDIDIENPEFFRNSLKLVEKDIERFLQLTE